MNTQSKNKFQYVVYSYDNFNLKSFLDFISTNFYFNRTNTILVSLGFQGNSVFYMTARQIGLRLTDSHNVDHYENICDVITMKITDVISKYEVTDFPNTVIISYKTINISENLLINQNSKQIVLDKVVGTKSELPSKLAFSYLPLSINSSSLGFLLIGGLGLDHINSVKSKILQSGLQVPAILNNLDLLNNSNVFIRDFKTSRNKIRKLLIIDCPLNLYNKTIIENTVVTSYIKSSYPNINPKNGFIRIVCEMSTGICLC